MKLVLAILIIYLFNDAVTIRSLLQNQRMKKLRAKKLEKLRSNSEENLYETKWFPQLLNHSEPTHSETWQQKYFISDRYFNQTNRTVIFLLIQGESEADPGWMYWGNWGVDLTHYFGAIFIQLEHRFYGDSKPKEKLSLENLRYLTSEQALADVANFISNVDLNITFEHEAQWIVFGGSYAGSLSAWFKLKYPQLVKGAVASSAPLQATLEFPQYFEDVAVDLKNVSKQCYNVIERTTYEFENLMKTPSGRRYLNRSFKLCSPLEDVHGNPNTTRYDVMNLFNSLADNFGGIAQYDKQSNYTLEWICDILTNTTDGKSEIERLAEFNAQMLEYNEEECFDYTYSNFIDSFRNLTYETSDSDRQWVFQTCNEFGFYQTSSNGTARIFGQNFPIDLSIKMCQDTFGEEFGAINMESTIQQTNIHYGGLSYDAENVVFIYGSVDPWHSLGLVESETNKATVILVNGTAHCADMDAPEEDDPEGLINARLRTMQLIESWLS